MRASPEAGVALRPPKGSAAFCRSISADLRVTGSVASRAREPTDRRIHRREHAAEIGRGLPRVRDQRGQARHQVALARGRIADLEGVEVLAHHESQRLRRR